MFQAGVPQVTPPVQYVNGKWPCVAYEDADGYSSIADYIYTLKKKAATDKSSRIN